MTLPELLANLERRAAEAEAIQAHAPVAVIYRQVADELRGLDSVDVFISYDSDRAAKVLGVSPKTIAHWCAAGKFPGARKTSGRGGKWMIPTKAIYDFQGDRL